MTNSKNEAKVRFTADTKSFSEEIKKINDDLKTNRAELKLAEAEYKNSGDAVDYLEKKQDLLETASAGVAEKVTMLNEKLKVAEDYLGKNSTEYKTLERAVISAKTEQQKFESELKSVSDALDDARNGADQAADSIDDIGTSSEGASKDASAFADVLKGELAAEAITTGLEAVAGAVKGIADECITLATDGKESINEFSAATGIAGDDLKDFEETMHEIYADNFGESLGDVSDAMETVYKQTGLTGDALKDATENALLLSDSLGYDVSETTRSASTLMQQFGITYDDAMNLIAQGNQKGLDFSDELLDSIDEYSVHFEQFGFTAEDMFNIMESGAESGAFNLDKIGDAVKEFGIRVKDGSDTTKEGFEAIGLDSDEMAQKFASGGETAKQAFYETIDALNALEDPVAQNTAGVDLFGTMWEDLGSEATLALADTNGSISTTTDALGQMNDVRYDDIGSAIEGIKRNLEEGIAGSIEESVLPALNDIGDNIDVEELSDQVETLTNNLIDGVQWIGEHSTAIGVAGGVIAGAAAGMAVYNGVQAIKTAMEIAEVPTLGALAASQWAVVAATAAAAAPFVLVGAAIAGVIAVGVLLYKNWDKVKAKAGELKEAVIEKFTALKEGAVNKFNDIKDGIVDKVKALKDKVSEYVEKIKGFFDFKAKIPQIKLPHFSITPEGWTVGDLLKGTIPHLGIEWRAKGAYFTGPTVVAQGLGEAGNEYALPLNKQTLRPLAEGIVSELKSIPGKAINIINNFNGTTVREEADINKIADAVNAKLATEVY